MIIFLFFSPDSRKKDSEDQREKYTTFTDLAALNYSSDLQKSGLSFDVSFYKAKKEVTISFFC